MFDYKFFVDYGGITAAINPAEELREDWSLSLGFDLLEITCRIILGFYFGASICCSESI